MKRTLCLLSASVLAALIAVPVFAADAPAPEKKPAAGQRRPSVLQRTEDALAKLDLNDDQKAKTKALLDDVKKQNTEIRKGEGTPADKRPKYAAVRKDMNTKLKGILTPDQQAKLKDLMKESAPPPAPKKDPAK